MHAWSPGNNLWVETHLSLGVGRCSFLVSSGDAIALVELGTAIFLRDGLRGLEILLEVAVLRQLHPVQVVGDRVDEPDLDATQQQRGLATVGVFLRGVVGQRTQCTGERHPPFRRHCRWFAS